MIQPYGSLGQVVSNSDLISTQLNTLTQQASSGLISESYAGLAPASAQQALDLQPQIAHLTEWQNSIQTATAEMGVTQGALTQIASIASNLYAELPNLNGLDPSTTDSIAANARAALQQMAGLLNTTDGSSYVFGGQDSTNPPVPLGDSILTSGFYTQINAAVGALGTNGAAATAASTLAIAGSNTAGTSPFSAYLSQPAATVNAALPAVQVGNGQMVTIGIAASTNAAVNSTGTSTTQSYMRDIMRALATIGSLSSSQVTSGADVAGLVADTQTSLSGAITALAQDQGVLGDQQTTLTNAATAMSATQTTLKGQFSNATDVDMAQTLTSLTETQTRLQASYQLISNLSSLSLVKFI